MPKVRKIVRLSPKTVSRYSSNPRKVGSSPRATPQTHGGSQIELTTVDRRVLEEVRRLAKPFPDVKIKVLDRTTVLIKNN